MDDNRKEERGNSIFSSARDELISRLVRRGAATVGRAALAATSEVWGPIVIAIGLILFFTVTIMVITGGPGSASEIPKTTESEQSTGFSSSRINTKFYCQYDPRWSSSVCNIAGFGCDPTALAMILASFGDTVWTPTGVALANNMGCQGATTIPQMISSVEWTKSLGYLVATPNIGFKQNFNLSLAKKYIDEGYLLLGVANITFPSGGQLKSGGHSFVITGVDLDNEYLTVLDPTYCKSDSNFVKRRLGATEVLCDSNGCGWYIVRAIKKL